MVKRRGGRKGPSLAYWFQQTMESGDASDKEAPPSNPKRERSYKKHMVGGNLHACCNENQRQSEMGAHVHHQKILCETQHILSITGMSRECTCLGHN